MLLDEIGEKYRKLDKELNPWIGSKYEHIRNAGTDITGKIGEEFIYNLLVKSLLEYSVIWDGDNNISQEDGVYDIKIIAVLYSFILRLEVKTATMGKNGSFQHEKILGKKFCDKILFLDITPNGFYITILNVEEIDYSGNEKCLLGRTLHIRSNGEQTKLDFGPKTIENGLKLNKTIYITDENDQTNILSQFLIKNLI